MAIGGMILYNNGVSDSAPSLYNKEETPAIEKEVKETPAWLQDADAVAAAEAVVKRKMLEAEKEQLDSEVKTLTEAYNNEVERLEARQLEIEKELGF